MNYQEQIKHPKWQKKRLEVLELHNFQCQRCGNKEKELHVHHPYYKRGAMIWEYDKSELESLCRKCHTDAHSIDEKIKKALALCGDKGKVLDFIVQLSSCDKKIIPPFKLATSVPEYISAIQSSEDDRTAKAIPLAEYYVGVTEIYSAHPDLEFSPSDSEEESASKLFRVLDLLGR